MLPEMVSSFSFHKNLMNCSGHVRSSSLLARLCSLNAVMSHGGKRPDRWLSPPPAWDQPCFGLIGIFILTRAESLKWLFLFIMIRARLTKRFSAFNHIHGLSPPGAVRSDIKVSVMKLLQVFAKSFGQTGPNVAVFYFVHLFFPFFFHKAKSIERWV